jgi:hypothetical protein
MKDCDIRSDLWPGVIEILSNLLAMNALSTSSYPFSYYSVHILNQLLKQDYEKNFTPNEEIEEKIIHSLRTAKKITSEILLKNDEELSSAVLQPAINDMKKLLIGKKSLFQKKFNVSQPASDSSSSGGGFEGGDIEKILVLFEQEKEEKKQLTKAGLLKQSLLNSELFEKMFDDVKHLENIKTDK